MRAAILLGLALGVTACARVPRLVRSDPPEHEALYKRALNHLDAANRQGAIDSALVYLDRYLSAENTQEHRREAIILQQLARDARQLARVQMALQQARSDTGAAQAAKAQTEPEARKRDEEALREIQRLKDELAKANEELERIRKRLATPKPPGER